MVANSVIDEIVKSLSFEVEASPQNKTNEKSNTLTNTPMNVKIRVRKNDGLTFGKETIFVPKRDRRNSVPASMRLKSSDQTILSFQVIMNGDSSKKIRKKARKSFFGSCLGAQYDDDDMPYLPITTHTAKVSEVASPSKSETKLTQNCNLYKVKDTAKSNVVSNTKKTSILGKCKPGGCLDPPFDEDKYCYKLAIGKNATNKNICTEPTTKLDTHNINNQDLSKSKEGNSILSIYEAKNFRSSIDTKYSDSIITYPSLEPLMKTRTSIDENKQKAINESAATFYSRSTKYKPIDSSKPKEKNKTYSPPIVTNNNHDASISNSMLIKDKRFDDFKPTSIYQADGSTLQITEISHLNKIKSIKDGDAPKIENSMQQFVDPCAPSPTVNQHDQYKQSNILVDKKLKREISDELFEYETKLSDKAEYIESPRNSLKIRQKSNMISQIKQDTSSLLNNNQSENSKTTLLSKIDSIYKHNNQHLSAAKISLKKYKNVSVESLQSFTSAQNIHDSPDAYGVKPSNLGHQKSNDISTNNLSHKLQLEIRSNSQSASNLSYLKDKCHNNKIQSMEVISFNSRSQRSDNHHLSSDENEKTSCNNFSDVAKINTLSINEQIKTTIATYSDEIIAGKQTANDNNSFQMEHNRENEQSVVRKESQTYFDNHYITYKESSISNNKNQEKTKMSSSYNSRLTADDLNFDHIQDQSLIDENKINTLNSNYLSHEFSERSIVSNDLQRIEKSDIRTNNTMAEKISANDEYSLGLKYDTVNSQSHLENDKIERSSSEKQTCKNSLGSNNRLSGQNLPHQDIKMSSIEINMERKNSFKPLILCDDTSPHKLDDSTNLQIKESKNASFNNINSPQDSQPGSKSPIPNQQVQCNKNPSLNSNLLDKLRKIPNEEDKSSSRHDVINPFHKPNQKLTDYIKRHESFQTPSLNGDNIPSNNRSSICVQDQILSLHTEKLRQIDKSNKNDKIQQPFDASELNQDKSLSNHPYTVPRNSRVTSLTNQPETNLSIISNQINTLKPLERNELLTKHLVTQEELPSNTISEPGYILPSTNSNNITLVDKMDLNSNLEFDVLQERSIAPQIAICNGKSDTVLTIKQSRKSDHNDNYLEHFSESPHNNIDEDSKMLKKEAVAVMNIGIQFIRNDKKETIIKTFDSQQEPLRYPGNSVVIIRSQTRNDISIPIDAEYDIDIVIRKKTPFCILPSDHVNDKHRNENSNLKCDSESAKLGTQSHNSCNIIRSKNKLQTTYSSIYGRNLIPLFKSIKYLKKEVDILASHQNVFKQLRLGTTKRPNPNRTVKFNHSCNCWRK